jgi:hypothetical protein
LHFIADAMSKESTHLETESDDIEARRGEPEEANGETSRFSTTQLHALLTRSTAASAVLQRAVDPPEEHSAPPPSEDGVLSKRSAVLVMPEERSVVRPIAPEPTAPIAPVVTPAAAPAPARTLDVVRDAPRGGYVKRRLFALAIIATVVASQPWWWNIGDLHARPPRAQQSAAAQ